MEVIQTLSPGARGTRRYFEKCAQRLICVRYRKDPARQRRLTTVELIVDEGPFISRGRVEKALNRRVRSRKPLKTPNPTIERDAHPSL